VLSAADLAGMQATLTESLPDTCTLLLDTLMSDGAGGSTVASTSSTTVACRVSPLRLTRSSKEAEIVEATRVIEESLWIITMPHGTVVEPRYRIGNGGREFEVVEALAPRSWELDVRVSTKLLNQGAG
jgi:hypothetical protein